MQDRNGSGWAPAIVRDVGEGDGEVYVIGLRATTKDGSWSLLTMPGATFRLTVLISEDECARS